MNTKLLGNIVRALGVKPERYRVLRNLKRLLAVGFSAYPYKGFQVEHIGLRSIIKKGMVVIDIGANVGDYSILFARWGAKVTAFEPTYIWSTLYKRTRNYDICCLNIALGEKDGRIAIYEDGGLSSASRKYAPKGIRRDIDLRRLDTIWKGLVDFIKIDVEGMELEVLRGARKTIERYRPIIFCEINEEAQYARGHTGQEVINYLKSLGYDCRIFCHIPYYYDILAQVA